MTDMDFDSLDTPGAAAATEPYCSVVFLRQHEGYSAGMPAGFPKSTAERLARAVNPKNHTADPIVRIVGEIPWPHERHLAGTEAPAADPKPTTRRRGGK